MLIVISPAKTLDYSDQQLTQSYTQPGFQAETEALVENLAGMSASKLGKLMNLSENLANLNYQRYQQFHFPFTSQNAKQALLAFKGDVYQGFELGEYVSEDFDFAQDHLRILSGLYGVLRPLDLMQPYRLEMGTRLKQGRNKNLYEFWGTKIAKRLNADMEAVGSDVLINLASKEYFKAIDTKTLKARIITPQFKEVRNGELKVIALFAKQARGMMSDYIIRHRITNPEDIKDFNREGYRFNDTASTKDDWVFSREKR